jgi:hypothetical protein
VPTTAWFAEAPPADEIPEGPLSGAQTIAREVDPIALAEAAQAAAAMFQIPGILRADGMAMPPFRVSGAALHGDELASVVGGHTLTRHGGHAGAVAIEPRGHRWTIAVLAAAVLIGVGAAVAIQLRAGTAMDRLSDVAPVKRAKPSGADVDVRQVTPLTPPPAIQPTIADPPAPPMQDTAPPPAEPKGTGTRPSGQRSPVARDAGKHKEPGILSVQSKPWSWVTVSGQRKETPDKFSLAPGTYVVKFYNEENGLTKYERVTIESGKRITLDEGMAP